VARRARHGVDDEGHRLSKVGRPTRGEAEAADGVLIPRNGVIEIRRAIETREKPAGFGVYQGNSWMKDDDVRLSRQADRGQFPPYDKVIPQGKRPGAVIVSRLGFLAALPPGRDIRQDKHAGVRIGSRRASWNRERQTPTWAPPEEET